MNTIDTTPQQPVSDQPLTNETENDSKVEDQSDASKCVVQRPSHVMMLEMAQAAEIESAGGETPPKTAIFVAHGMGQQLKYATPDQIAQELLDIDARKRGGKRKQPPTGVVTIQHDGGLMQGIKLLLRIPGKPDHEVHVFEGYWAPLTEGAITLRDVIGFFFTAGLNGLKNGSAFFYRWLFGEFRRFPPNLNVTIYLLTALAVVASLVVMNSAIATVAAFSSPFTSTPKWLAGLKPDLTTTFNIFVFFALVFGLCLLVASRARAKRRSISVRDKWAKLSWALFALTIAATILCGVTIPLLFYGHVYRGGDDASGFWQLAFGENLIKAVNDSVTAFIVLLFLAAIISQLFGGSNKRSLPRLLKTMKQASALTVIATIIVFGAVLAIFIFLAKAVWSSSGPSLNGMGQTLGGVSWPLLIGLSWVVRRLLVQYVGDVAVYLQPHTLDKFNSLRERIRDHVTAAGRAVYACPRADGTDFDYDNVLIVGHSLGSVIVYDTLNRLINDDEFLEAEKKLRVAKRTKLLLTFGSPLDKISFLFALQKDKTSEEREAMVAATQPLIQRPEFRQFDWVNIYSANDIISGDLNFYDPPARSEIPVNRIQNMVDKQATTLLAAHIEYWENPLLFQELHDKITSLASSGRNGGGQ